MDGIELILQELQKINGRLDSMEGRLDSMEGRLDSMEERLTSLEDKVDSLIEAHEETRCGVNSLLEWAEECGNVIEFPLPKVK